MNLSYLALSVCALSLCATAQTQTNSLVPTSQQKTSAAGTVKVQHKKVLPGKGAQQHHTAAQGGHQLLASAGTDDCTTPDLVVGVGTFPVDSTAATTGAIGQTEAACAFYSTTVMDNDVWFTWVAPNSGTTILDLCGGIGTGEDSRIAVYPGTTCPGAGSAIACNDDSCNFVTTVSFVATAGNSYVFQFGSFPAAAGYVGTFNLSQPVALPEDSCSTPEILVGPGPYAVDTLAATAGVEGQVEALCNLAGGPAIDQDTWHVWTSVTGGVATVSMCGGLAGADSKIAVYPGNTCPVNGTALACDDDTCAGFESTLNFASTAGQSYMIQTGSFPGAGGYNGTYTIVESTPPTNDDCSTPVTLAPTGPYAHDNTLATTGLQGQSEALCNFYSLTGIDNDLWYDWTATFNGFAKLTFCTFTGADTRVSIYPTGGCPAPGSSLACNDDVCNFQSEVTWAVTSGTSYLIQAGNFPGAAAAAGAFDIVPFVPALGDDCGTPIAIAGSGPHAFDTTAATQGAQGQTEAECNFYGSSSVNHDIWYCWTAPSSGKFDVQTLGMTTADTKIAVYDGCGCPATAALSCNDDACGTSFQSATTFIAVSGQSYTIQMGAFPTATGGIGTFTITPNVTPEDTCSYDDGIGDNAGRSGTPVTGWLQRYGQVGVNTGVFDIQVVWGGGVAGGLAGVVNGSAGEVLLFDDPNDDGDPADAVLIDQIPVVIANANTDTFNTVTLPTPRLMSGYFWVGAATQHATVGVFPIPMDQSSCILDNPARMWVLGDVSGTLNYASLPANSVYITCQHQFDVDGTSWMIRANCQREPGFQFCSNSTLGTDHTTACPCGNVGAGPNGCAHSFSAAGANLSASGMQAFDSPSTAGQVILQSSNTPAASFTLFIQHSLVGDAVFHDGVICTDQVTPNLVRLRGRNAVGGVATFPNNSFPNDATLTLHSRGGVLVGSGATRYYAAFYRNASTTFCPPATANVTNGYTITW